MATEGIELLLLLNADKKQKIPPLLQEFHRRNIDLSQISNMSV